MSRTISIRIIYVTRHYILLKVILFFEHRPRWSTNKTQLNFVIASKVNQTTPAAAGFNPVCFLLPFVLDVINNLSHSILLAAHNQNCSSACFPSPKSLIQSLILTKKKNKKIFIFHNTCTDNSIHICDKYHVEGWNKSLSHPSWPHIVTNRYDITDNGEQKNKTKR